MTWGAVAVAGAAVVGSVIQSRAQSGAAEAQAGATEAAIAEQEAARLSFEQRTQPFADIGLEAADPLRQLLGFADPRAAQIQTELDRINQRLESFPTQQTGAPGGGGLIAGTLFGQPQLTGGTQQPEQFGGTFFGGQQPGPTSENLIARRDALLAEQEGLQAAPALGPDAQLAEINPLVSFLRQEGFEDIQESAAARGRLGAGGTLEDLTRFNTNLSATIIPQLQQQRFNQLFNVLGLGANVTTGQGTAGLQTATNISNLLGQQGATQAQSAINQGNITTNALGQIVGAAGLFNAQQQPQPVAGTAGLPVNQQSFAGFA